MLLEVPSKIYVATLVDDDPIPQRKRAEYQGDQMLHFCSKLASYETFYIFHIWKTHQVVL